MSHFISVFIFIISLSVIYFTSVGQEEINYFIIFLFTSVIFFFPNNKNNKIYFISFMLIISTLNWFYISISNKLNYNINSFQAVLPKALVIPILIYLIYKIIDFKKNKNLKFIIFLFSILLIVSFYKSIDKNVALNYILNTFIPFLTIVFFSIFTYKNNIFLNLGLNKIIESTIYFLIILNSFFILLEVFNFFQSIEFFEYPGQLLRNKRDAWYGNYITTFIDGSRIPRFPGIFSDPILSGYFWNSVFGYFFIVKKSKITQYISVLFIVITFSKGAYLLMFLTLTFNIILKIKIKSKTRFYLTSLYFVFSIFLLIFLSIRENNLDSSVIHVQGLYLPFTKQINLNYFIGESIGESGNMGGWVNEGAESFIGLVKNSIGLFGFLIVLYFIYKILSINIKNSNNYISKYIIIIIIPTFIVSFLQENSFNIPYVFIKVMLMISLFNLSLYKDSDINKKNVNA